MLPNKISRDIHCPPIEWNHPSLFGRTARYIAERFDCSISTIRRIIKRYRKTGRWHRLPGSGHPKKITAHDERYLAMLVKRLRFRSLAQITPEFVTHLGHPLSKRTVQRMIHGQGIYSRIALQKRTLVSRTGSDDDAGVPEHTSYLSALRSFQMFTCYLLQMKLHLILGSFEFTE